MNALIVFPLLAAAAVWLAGRRDASRDPRLTTLALALLAIAPLFLFLPKIPLLPAPVLAEAPAAAPIFPFWVLTALWLAGFLFCATRLMLSAIGLTRWHRRSTFIETTSDGVEIRELDGLRGPVAAGVFRKTIFVPTGWATWDDSTRETVLLHELAHHRRHDPLVRWIAAMAVAVHWFNPLVHWMNRRLALQCEHACDRRVIDTGVRADRYAEMLCRFAARGRMDAAGLAIAEMSSLEARVRHLMTPRASRGFFTLAALASLVIWGGFLLPLLGRKATPVNAPDQAEVEMRLSANPFPADSP
ncbi:M56 family metallopeptidase [Luteolibacter ambystomatis]|uniref:M56 family metallopeptidase n=1 Tax=Luteolibacter ambystomatis TaxID=2824561 RepID=A0A975IY30_9BACT|nr:M56 family metallopeptidase [Luteolibacter ambystomatis]QUE49453.1 M56 family metallopeptidase [Luteolibacter ambystomatis]